MYKLKMLIGFVIISVAGFATATEDSTYIGDLEMAQDQHSTAFDQMKKMLGKWEGKLTQPSGNVVDTSSEFRLVSNGNTITEKLIEDGVEMLTTYTDTAGQLVVKHYCALGTEPVFKVVDQSAQSLKVSLDSDKADYHPEHHSYVNSMRWTSNAVDTDTVVVDATIYMDGELQTQQTVLRRVN